MIFIINNFCKDEHKGSTNFHFEYGFYTIIFSLLISKIICEVNSADEVFKEFLTKIVNCVTVFNYLFLVYLAVKHNRCCLLANFKNNNYNFTILISFIIFKHWHIITKT